MSNYCFNNVKIKGISSIVPPKEICIYDEAKYYDNNIKKIDRMRKMVGFYKRRVVEEGVTPSDLAINAAENLIADMKIDKSTIDALVFVVQKPDYNAPATAFYIHNKLGLPETCPAFDVNQGCTGWVYGLWIASQMIESKTCKRVLLVAGDTPAFGIPARDRISAPVFGDGGAATLLEYSENCEKSFYTIETQSDGYEAIMVPASGQRCFLNLSKKKDFDLFLDIIKHPIKTKLGYKTHIFNAYMDGIAVFNYTMTVVPPNIKRLMEFANVKYDDIECLCLHQANKQIIQTVGNAAGFPEEKVPYYAFENYGNNTMASIPVTINSVLKEKAEKEKIKILCSAFGNGLTCSSCVLTLDSIYVSGVRDYVKPKDFITRKKYINYWNRKLKGE